MGFTPPLLYCLGYVPMLLFHGFVAMSLLGFEVGNKPASSWSLTYRTSHAFFFFTYNPLARINYLITYFVLLHYSYQGHLRLRTSVSFVFPAHLITLQWGLHRTLGRHSSWWPWTYCSGHHQHLLCGSFWKISASKCPSVSPGHCNVRNTWSLMWKANQER